VITSHHNQKIKDLRKLTRREARDSSARFAAEGEDLLEAAEAAGWPAVERFVAAGSAIDGTEVEPEILAAVSSLGSGTRAIGVYEQRWAEAPSGPLCIGLWGVGDPGNVGTILRSALAFGASSVALGPGSADPFSPKAVRASMGAVFSVPVARVDGVSELPRPVTALVARAGDVIGEQGSGTLLVGSERSGLADEIVAACDAVAHIPIATESLNAAMAATVALYAVTNKRPTAAPTHTDGSRLISKVAPR
jgi:TrmH family RNA methyltransferase